MRFLHLVIILAAFFASISPAQSTRPAARTPFAATRPGQVLDLTLDQLGNFDVDADKPVIPSDVSALTGVTVRLHGYMIPIDGRAKSCRFALVRKYWEGGIVTDSNPVPKFQETVLVTCGNDKAVDVDKFFKKPIVVEGKLSVGSIRENDTVVAIFSVRMDRCTFDVPATTRPAAARTPHPAPKPGETLDLTVDQLGNFDFDEEKPVIPADVVALDAVTVRLHGWIEPLDKNGAGKTCRFALVEQPNTTKLQGTVVVTCPKEKAVTYTDQRVVVEGKLSVTVIRDGEYIVQVFGLSLESCTIDTKVLADPPTTQRSDALFELRATTAFNAGDYAAALPMLKAIVGGLKDQPDQLAMAQEQIRVCEKSQAGPSTRPAAAAGPTTAPAPAADARTPHPAPKHGEILDLSIKELGNFHLDEDDPVIPDDVKALNGTTVRLRGYMIPLDQAENISRFALVPSTFQCCIGPRSEIQHTILVNCPKGKSVSYCSDEIVIEGKLTVDMTRDDGYLVGVFNVETTSVKPAAK